LVLFQFSREIEVVGPIYSATLVVPSRRKAQLQSGMALGKFNRNQEASIQIHRVRADYVDLLSGV
jgi:hypothetical protein